MKDLYPSLAPEQRRSESAGSKALDELVEHLEHSSDGLDPAFRRSGIRTLVSDLNAYLSGGTDWSAQSASNAVASLKLLGRSSVATEELASHFPLLISFANLVPLASLQLEKQNSQNSSRVKSTVSNPLVVQDSLRIIANTLFLHPLSRSSSDLLPALKPLVELAVNLQEKSSRQGSVPSHEDQNTNSFLASRVIFLITAVPSNLVIELIEKTYLVRNFKKAFEQELALKIKPNGHSYRHILQDTLIEYLKIIFNVMVHYPKSILQFDHTPLDTVNLSSSPTTNHPEHASSHGSPSTSVGPPTSPRRLSSLKQRFNNQINFKKFRFRNQSESSDSQDHQESLQEMAQDSEDSGPSHSLKKSFFPRNSSHSKVYSQSSSIADEPQELSGPVTVPANTAFAGLLPYLVQLFLLEPIPQPPNLKPPFNSYMQAFLNFLPSAHCFFDNYSNLPTASGSNGIPPLIHKLIMVIDRVTEYYCPGDPDDRLVKQKCQTDGIDLDVDLTQVILLTANLISLHSPCTSSSSSSAGLTKESREALIELIVPAKVDRTIGLNKQPNLIGRILRLMNSVGFETLKQTCGEFLQALYAHDTDHLASQVGYGPLAGYFLSIGKSALNPENNRHLSNSEINPITGTYWASSEDSDGQATQPSVPSDAEKEREAERLCELFDRMNRGGVISVEDPRKLAVQSGRFQQIEDSVQASQEEQDKAEEEQALKELQRYKEKKSNNGHSNTSKP